MISQIISIINIFIVPIISLVVYYLKRDKGNKITLRYIIFYCIALLAVLILSSIVSFIILFLIGMMFSLESVFYTIYSTIISILLGYAFASVKISLIKINLTKDENGKEKD